jgi:hypothetical protein
VNFLWFLVRGRLLPCSHQEGDEVALAVPPDGAAVKDVLAPEVPPPGEEPRGQVLLHREAPGEHVELPGEPCVCFSDRVT